jgi:hypothetical protein
MDTSALTDGDWYLIAAYLKVVKPFDTASRLLGGDKYPAACMVIPMLDEVLYKTKNSGRSLPYSFTGLDAFGSHCAVLYCKGTLYCTIKIFWYVW